MSDYAKNVNVFNHLFPQEKVYLHLDNTAYFRDETIWLKAYVIRTDSNSLSHLSRVLYVELINPVGDVLERKKLYLKNGQANGEFILNKPMKSGFYEVRAYTRYMTNWSGECAFSRTIPIFERPLWHGNYSVRNIDTTLCRSRLEGYGQKRKKKETLSVRFYPEGGHLVRGLRSRVAFDITDDTGAPTKAKGFLMTASGDTLGEVSTMREGRGLFSCTPDNLPHRLLFRELNGSMSAFSLPQALDTGCVMTLSDVMGSGVVLHIEASPQLYGHLFGLTILRGGHIYAFDTIRVGREAVEKRFDRHHLSGGVNELTLFSEEGRIWADRLFFIPPDTTKQRPYVPITIHPRSRILVPYGKMTLDITSRPGACFSLSVLDASTTLNGCEQNVETWSLLSSDVKGYVAHPEYYFENDDAVHRQAADLLMMVQGWRRYDWRQMAGVAPFIKRQPIEDRLYIDGQLEDKGLFSNHSPLGGFNVSAVLYNQEGNTLEGTSVTDSAGYFAFAVPNCSDEWVAMIITFKDNKYENCHVLLNRHFAPPARNLFYEEFAQIPIDSTEEVRMIVPQNIIDSLQAAEKAALLRGDRTRFSKTIKLSMASVTAQGKLRNNDWSRENALRHSEVLYYDSNQLSEDMADKGKRIPSSYGWCISLPFVRDLVKNKYYELDWIDYSPQQIGGTGLGGGGCAANPKDGRQLTFPKTNLDEIRSIYIVVDRNRKNINLLLYPHKFIRLKEKGYRRTYFDGFNEPATFQMNDYSVLPKDTDFRRTLLWLPNVQVDSEGKAHVDVWNNSSCHDILFSAEGILFDGKPAMYKAAGH